MIIKGRLVGPTTVELEEPVEGASGESVLVQIDEHAGSSAGGFLEFLRTIPAGRKSRDQIDGELRDERDSWGDR